MMDNLIVFRVWTLFFAELLISIFTFHGFWVGATSGSLLAIIGYNVNVTGPDSEQVSPAILWSLQALACLTGFVSFVTHGFFCWRIWGLKRSRVIPVFVMTVSSLQFAMVAYGGIQFGLCPSSLNNDTDKMEFFTPVWLSGSLLCDVTITVYMTIILHKQGTGSSFQATKSLSANLVKLTIETGLVTTVAAVVELILATTLRNTVWHLAVFYTISKLYANCVLANLNARQGLREHGASQSLVFSNNLRANFGSQSCTNQDVKPMQIFRNVETDVETVAYHGLMHKNPPLAEP
ncbi:hypothetical protein BV22DRAFT_1031769 [Leucogyrophana mollusca]|uniref:Uncharacterized protein n=1 Tax=Leucogyrophana mollusca TaxID=85980 RepID=A0ACB8BQE2_9AGAM|nr:hypothetical protein BV22DRAFT_1031769 [Leucogyrophana mollusca]